MSFGKREVALLSVLFLGILMYFKPGKRKGISETDVDSNLSKREFMTCSFLNKFSVRKVRFVSLLYARISNAEVLEI